MLLVVEDDEGVQLLARLVLEGEGYQVLLADDGRQGVELFRRHAADIEAVLLDLTLPHVSGVEALRQIRALRADVPVLLTSGLTEHELPPEYRGQEKTDFLPKPFAPSTLLASMRRLLGRQG